jgi:hypothetical protein
MDFLIYYVNEITDSLEFFLNIARPMIDDSVFIIVHSMIDELRIICSPSDVGPKTSQALT